MYGFSDDVSDEDFLEIVDRDIRKNSSPEEIIFLTNNVDRWIIVLNDLMRDAEIQLSSFRTTLASRHLSILNEDKPMHERERKWIETKIHFEKKRTGAKRFHSSVETRLQYAKTIRRMKAQAAHVNA